MIETLDGLLAVLAQTLNGLKDGKSVSFSQVSAIIFRIRRQAVIRRRRKVYAGYFNVHRDSRPNVLEIKVVNRVPALIRLKAGGQDGQDKEPPHTNQFFGLFQRLLVDPVWQICLKSFLLDLLAKGLLRLSGFLRVPLNGAHSQGQNHNVDKTEKSAESGYDHKPEG